MPITYIAFGSNLGDREAHIQQALRLLEQEGVSIRRCSSILETDPVGGPAGQGKFLNGVVKAETQLPPRDLLETLLNIEKRLGRLRSVPNAPRTIDLDILLYDGETVDTEDLTIPHPRMREREFVMKPLSEIEPGIF